ncbi:MAG: hypothetical protein NVSMB16_16840 [Acidimicrobiales bacterium]
MSSMESSDAAHAMLGYKSGQGRFHVAVCSCGWESEDMSSAGLAYSAWDTHAERPGAGGE